MGEYKNPSGEGSRRGLPESAGIRAIWNALEDEGRDLEFAGISMLLPIYEKLVDGAEVLWTKRGRMTKEKALALAKRKPELPVFDDSER